MCQTTVVPAHATKAYSRIGVHLHSSLTSGLVRSEQLISYPSHFAPGKSIIKWAPELVQTHHTCQKPLALVRNEITTFQLYSS